VGGPAAAKGKEGSISFLKKRNKKLLLIIRRVRNDLHASKRTKVFWFFFSKKNCFLPAVVVKPHHVRKP
jgi:hypothetical protein